MAPVSGAGGSLVPGLPRALHARAEPLLLLSAGAIAAIVLGVFAFVQSIIIYCMLKKSSGGGGSSGRAWGR